MVQSNAKRNKGKADRLVARFTTAVITLVAREKQVIQTKALVQKAWKAYMTLLKPEVIKELKALTWVKTTGRNAKGRRVAVLPKNSALLKLRKLADRVSYQVIESWRGWQFLANPAFCVEVQAHNCSSNNDPTVTMNTLDLRGLGILNVDVEKKRRKAARDVAAESGLDAREIKEAIASFKGKRGK